MKKRAVTTLILVVALGFAAARLGLRAQAPAAPPQKDDALLLPEERKHLRNIRQLTFGGQNAEAYFSADDKQLQAAAKIGIKGLSFSPSKAKTKHAEAA